MPPRRRRSIIGLIRRGWVGKERLLRLAAGIDQPESGAVERPESGRLLGPLDALNFAPTPALLIDGTLARHDPLVRERAAVALDRMRRDGSTILLVSHDEELLRRLADEIWWLQEDVWRAGRSGGDVWPLIASISRSACAHGARR